MYRFALFLFVFATGFFAGCFVTACMAATLPRGVAAAPACPCAGQTCPCSDRCGCGCAKGRICECGPILGCCGHDPEPELLHPPAPDLYGHLPDSACCARNYGDIGPFHNALKWALEDIKSGNVECRDAKFVRDLEQESAIMQRHLDAWFACWWVTWPNANDAQKSEWAEKLLVLIGPEAYHSGKIPTPFLEPGSKSP